MNYHRLSPTVLQWTDEMTSGVISGLSTLVFAIGSPVPVRVNYRKVREYSGNNREGHQQLPVRVVGNQPCKAHEHTDRQVPRHGLDDVLSDIRHILFAGVDVNKTVTQCLTISRIEARPTP